MTDLKSLQFIGGVFFDYELPKERLYLYHYFSTSIEKAFLRYYYCFRDCEYFTDHTGYYCQKRWLKLLTSRHDRIIAVHDKAKEDMTEDNLSLLAKIESGKFTLKGYYALECR